MYIHTYIYINVGVEVGEHSSSLHIDLTQFDHLIHLFYTNKVYLFYLISYVNVSIC